MTPFLSIIIPAYNEAKRITDTLQLVKDFVDAQEYETEVIAIDDGSTDETVARIKEAQADFSHLKLLQNEINQGKGASVKRGMLEATGQWRLFMDADHSTPVTEIAKLLPYTDCHDIVIGSRYSHDGKIHIKQPLKRRIVSRSGNLAIQLLILPNIADTQCGFKLFSAKAAQDVFSRQTMSRWSFDIELLAIARQLGYSVKEVGVDWFDSPSSSLRASRAAVRSFKDLLQIRRNVKKGIYS